FQRARVIEIGLSLPVGYDPESFAGVVHSLSLCREPLSFELVGTPSGIITQLAVGESDAARVRKQLEGSFPEAAVQAESSVLESAWGQSHGRGTAVVDFGLLKEFMRLLRTGQSDVLVGIAAAMAELQESELGLFQVIFQVAREEWRESILQAVHNVDRKPL